jgi:hypothetical protein
MNKKSLLIASGSLTASTSTEEVDKVHEMLEKEKQTNKLDSWNKIDKMMKLRKLNAFADRYARQNNLSIQEIKALKSFFSQCLDTMRLCKSKDVVYDRETQEIKSIPSLFMHPSHRNFTLRIMDVKRVSTIKSLTPSKINTTNTVSNTIHQI